MLSAFDLFDFTQGLYALGAIGLGYGVILVIRRFRRAHSTRSLKKGDPR